MEQDEQPLPKYAPEVFLQEDLEDARAIILTPEAGLTTDQRWELETPWLQERIKFEPGLVIDYGCGIGRMSKVIDKENPVLGVDISPTMRRHAPDYVAKPEFAITHPFFLRYMVEAGLRAVGGLAIWALQHCLDLEYDCQLIYDALLPGAKFYTLDRRRFVPATTHDHQFIWANDGKSVEKALFDVGFTFDSMESPPTTLCHEGTKFQVWIR